MNGVEKACSTNAAIAWEVIYHGFLFPLSPEVASIFFSTQASEHHYQLITVNNSR